MNVRIGIELVVNISIRVGIGFPIHPRGQMVAMEIRPRGRMAKLKLISVMQLILISVQKLLTIRI